MWPLINWALTTVGPLVLLTSHLFGAFRRTFSVLLLQPHWPTRLGLTNQTNVNQAQSCCQKQSVAWGCDVKFTDGQTEILTANVIAENSSAEADAKDN